MEFTELCRKLGWKSKRTDWDILPLVVSANGHDPDFFEYPRDLILEVPITHPTYVLLFYSTLYYIIISRYLHILWNDFVYLILFKH